MIDSGHSMNVATQSMVDQLKIPIEDQLKIPIVENPHPYKIAWVNDTYIPITK